jgi:hypothetical protein
MTRFEALFWIGLLTALCQGGRVIYDYKVSGPIPSFKIGMGSCFAEYRKENHIFRDILKEDLDLWVWLGDIAYFDSK